MTGSSSERESSGECAWQIHGRFTIDAESEEWAQAALDGIERAAKRAPASVTIHVHISVPVEMID